MNALGETAQHVQMKGLWAPIPINARRVVAKAFLKANGFEVRRRPPSLALCVSQLAGTWSAHEALLWDRWMKPTRAR